jgi:membrane fusion protein, copper/silver efflux system
MNITIARGATRTLLSAACLLLVACGPGEHAGHQPATEAAAGTETALEHARRHLDPTFVCPMHPQIVRSEPGNCPICGMALVRRDPQRSDGVARAPSVEVDGRMRQALGLRSAAVERRDMAATARAPAQVIVDENRIAHVHSRVRGWVETLAVHAVGERVSANQVLLEIYSPELSSAQEDYLIAVRLEGRTSRSERAAAARLRTLGVDERFIGELAERGTSLTRVPLRAPRAGVVTALNVRHGMYVEPTTDVVEITDLDQVWIRADLFPEQLDRLGDEIYGAFRIAGVPERVWRGKAEYVYPEIDALTQTVHVRFPVPNRQGHLKVGVFMDGSLRGAAREGVLVIPSEALIRTADGDRVVVEEGEGRFRPLAVHAGHSAEGFTEILHGLGEGQRVVVNAQFLLDAESALRAGLDRLGGGHAH